jgi:hypothetical protein
VKQGRLFPTAFGCGVRASAGRFCLDGHIGSMKTKSKNPSQSASIKSHGLDLSDLLAFETFWTTLSQLLADLAPVKSKICLPKRLGATFSSKFLNTQRINIESNAGSAPNIFSSMWLSMPETASV